MLHSKFVQLYMKAQCIIQYIKTPPKRQIDNFDGGGDIDDGKRSTSAPVDSDLNAIKAARVHVANGKG